MKAYTVHLHRSGLDSDNDIVLVVEGFCWGACVLSLIWALWHRMWLVALGLAGVSVVVNALIYILGMDVSTGYFSSVGIAILIGLVANDLRRWNLARLGFVDSGVALGDNQDEALARFLDDAPAVAKEIV